MQKDINMQKEKIKNIINHLTMILFIGTLITSLILVGFYGPIKGVSYNLFLGLSKKTWIDLHLWLYLSFAVFAIINFLLGWKKIKKKQRDF